MYHATTRSLGALALLTLVACTSTMVDASEQNASESIGTQKSATIFVANKRYFLDKLLGLEGSPKSIQAFLDQYPTKTLYKNGSHNPQVPVPVKIILSELASESQGRNTLYAPTEPNRMDDHMFVFGNEAPDFPHVRLATVTNESTDNIRIVFFDDPETLDWLKKSLDNEYGANAEKAATEYLDIVARSNAQAENTQKTQIRRVETKLDPTQ